MSVHFITPLSKNYVQNGHKPKRPFFRGRLFRGRYFRGPFFL